MNRERANDRARGGAIVESAGGCLLPALGALAGLLLWTPRAAYSIDGGFEGHARDLSVVFVDLPLILVGASVLPLVAWVLTLRRTGRIWPAALASLAVLALFLWGVPAVWHPRRTPDPGYGPGI
ncbi:hypothetical protein [Streptomyces sp. NPDC056069]|uniref:hypothetical protein n=1 Tax=Streptomyces sp. NPDC056069 TaxID=3345702 RepID=UPI0035DBBFAE